MHLKDPTLLRTQAFIQGEWVNAANHATHEVHNPATGEKLGTVPDMGAAETRRAIEAAHAAFPAWAAKTAKERGTPFCGKLVRPDDCEPGRPGHAS